MPVSAMNRLTDPLSVLKTSLKYIETVDRKGGLLALGVQIDRLIQESRDALTEIEKIMALVREESKSRPSIGGAMTWKPGGET